MADITFQQAVEQIKNALDIVEVISKYVVLKKSGHNFMGLCPFHNEKTPSFTVTPQRQIYKCFGCGEGGDVINFLMKINNQTFGEVIQEQADILGIELPKTYNKEANEKNKKEKTQLLAVMKNALTFYHNNLKKNDKALSYLEKRGVTKVAIDKFFLGLAPNSLFDLKNYLKSKEGGGFTNDQLLKAGLVIETNNEHLDRFKNRIIIPIFDYDNNCIAFGARAIMENQSPKYLNSPDSMIYNKSNVLFGLNSAKEAIKEEDSVIVMEGYFDVISAQVNGVKNAVASCGTALTPQHIKLISRYTPSRKIYLAFDADSAGIKATQTGGEVIKNIFKNLGNIKQYDSSYMDMSNSVCEIRVVSQIGGKDPDEFIREFGADEYKKQIKNAPLLLDFQLSQVYKHIRKNPSAQEKSEIVRQIVEILSEIENDVILSDYVRQIADKLDVEEGVIKKQVILFRQQQGTPNVKKNEDKNTEIKSIRNSLETQYSAMESNLIKLALSADSIEKRVYLKQSIEGYKSPDTMNSTVIEAIDKMLTKVNNIDELAKKLFAQFCNDNEITKYLTDLTFSANEFESLSYEDFTQSIGEIFDRLNNLKEKKIKNKIRQKYKNNNITEEQEIAISKEIYEQFGYRR